MIDHERQTGEWVHVSEVERLESRLRDLEVRLAEAQHESHTDYLTGVLNRRGFELIVEHIWSEADRAQHEDTESELTILCFDLDNFKDINDTYGHNAGDHALQHTVMLISERLRESDVLARFGGDEFVACLVGSDEEASRKVGAEMANMIAGTSIAYGSDCFSIQISTGAAQRQDEESWRVTFDRADKALYRNKRVS